MINELSTQMQSVVMVKYTKITYYLLLANELEQIIRNIVEKIQLLPMVHKQEVKFFSSHNKVDSFVIC